MKKQLFYILFTICFLLRGMTSYSQDPNYSQFFASPLTISPALAGKSDAKLEANSIYRKQSFGAGVNYNTKLISVDGRLFENYDNNNTSFLGIGAMFLSDDAMAGIYKNTFFSLNSSYHLTLDKYQDHSHSLTAGLGFTYNKINIDYASLNTSEQLNLYGFDRTLPTGEANFKGIPATTSTSAGLLYSYATDTKVIDVGISGYKFYKNQISVFGDGTQYVSPRYNAHVNYSKFIDNKTLLFLKGYYQIQEGNNYFIAGGHVEYSINEIYQDFQESFNLGLYYRLKNAIIPYIGFTYNQLQFGFSYDIQVNQIKNAAIRPNTFELSMIFKNQKKSWNPLL